jgi:hypothetical protein
VTSPNTGGRPVGHHGQVSGSAASWPSIATTGPRSYISGAFVGAALLLLCSLIFGWPITTSVPPPDPAELAASAPVGACLTWSKPDASNLTEVDCATPHLFEVTGSLNLSGQFPAGAALPSQADFGKAAQLGCTAGATSYLGKLDPNGRYVVTALKPNEQQWRSGDRTLRCGLQSSTPSGTLLATRGSAKGQDQSAVYPVGTCLALVGKAPGGPTGCTQGHAYEIVGLVDLSGSFPSGGYPATNAQQNALGKLCLTAASTYTKNADLGKLGLTLTWSTIPQASWNAGSRKVNCEVGTPLPDGSGVGLVTNSVHNVGG